jgi:hypothetical protein
MASLTSAKVFNLMFAAKSFSKPALEGARIFHFSCESRAEKYPGCDRQNPDSSSTSETSGSTGALAQCGSQAGLPAQTAPSPSAAKSACGEPHHAPDPPATAETSSRSSSGLLAWPWGRAWGSELTSCKGFSSFPVLQPILSPWRLNQSSQTAPWCPGHPRLRSAPVAFLSKISRTGQWEVLCLVTGHQEKRTWVESMTHHVRNWLI